MKVFLLFLAVAGACRVADDCVLCSRDCYYLIFEGGGGICSRNLDFGGDFIGVIPQGSSIMCPNHPPTDSISTTSAPPKEPITKPVTHFGGGSSTHDYNAIVREENDEIIGKRLPDSTQMDYTAIVREKNEEIIGEMPITTTIPVPKYREVSSSSSHSSASASSSGWIVAGAIASVVFIFVLLLLIGFKLRKVVERAYHRHHDELCPSDLV